MSNFNRLLRLNKGLCNRYVSIKRRKFSTNSENDGIVNEIKNINNETKNIVNEIKNMNNEIKHMSNISKVTLICLFGYGLGYTVTNIGVQCIKML